MTEDEEERPKCGLCLYMEKGPINPDNVTQRSYFCKRNPPVVIVMPAQGGVAMHTVNPMVNPDTWCGEYDPIEDPDEGGGNGAALIEADE